MKLEDITKEIEALEARSAALVTAGEKATTSEEITALSAVISNEIQPELLKLTAARDEQLREIEVKSLKGTVGTLEEAIKELRKGFPVASPEGKGIVTNDKNPYTDGSHSFYGDIKMANKGRQEAMERLGLGSGYSDIKALTEGTGAQGGYLVQQLIERQIIDTRELDNVLRSLCSKLNVTTNSLELDQITLGTTAGWVAELATKPEGTSLTLATVSASVFVAAGLATISNQLLADSNPAVDALVTRDLAKRLIALEETAFLAGTGTAQPLGILNTPGLSTTAITDTGVSTTGGLLDKVLDAIAQVQADFGNPTAILMHPRTWTRILKDKNAAGTYTYGAPSDAIQNAWAIENGRTVFSGPTRTLWGVPVVLSNRMPTNLGGGTNESRVIVGDFSEALILDRQGITVDESPHVYFTSNQTVFRAEQRVGFTAARQPKAFCIIGGVGMVNG